MVPRKVHSHVEKKENRPLSYTINTKYAIWIENLNVRPETINILGQDVDGKLLGIDLGNDSLNMILKVNAQGKINKWNYVKQSKGNHQKIGNTAY